MALSTLKLHRFVDSNMEAATMRQFVDLFRDFLEFNMDENWPVESTPEQEIRNAYKLAAHIETSVDRFQQRGVLDEFLNSTLFLQSWRNRQFLRNCFTKPSDIVLKKIINSQTSIKQVEVGVKLYLEIYSGDMLQLTLARLLLETASRETLMRNLSTEFSTGQLVNFTSTLLLNELSTCNKPEEVLNELLNNTNQDCIDLLGISLLNRKPKYANSVQYIKVAVEQTMLSKKQTDKDFWKYFFGIRHEFFLEICQMHRHLFKLICGALFDVGKLLKEQMSTEFFYIDMTHHDLRHIVKIICIHTELMNRLYDNITESSDDPDFWEELIQNCRVN